MTLLGLGKLVRHYLKLVILLPVICAVAAALMWFLTPATFQASSSLVTNADLAVMGGYAQNEAAKYSQNGIIVTSIANPTTQSIAITAEGKDYGGCVAAANATVLAVGDAVRAANPDFLVNINEAASAIDISQSLSKLVLFAFLIGLFVALCIVIFLDIAKTPIKSRADIEEISELPVIGEIPARDKGERLLANIRFVAGNTPSTIAVVPIGGSGVSIACAELTNALTRAGVAAKRVKADAHAQGLRIEKAAGTAMVIECFPLSEGMGAAYIARDADLTVLCATEWLDSRRVMENVVSELNLAKAKFGGVVLLVDGRPTEDFR